MIRLMEVLLRGGTQLNAWRSTDIHQAIFTAWPVASTYTLINYSTSAIDLRKMRAHGLLDTHRTGLPLPPHREAGQSLTHVHPVPQRVCGPLANSLSITGRRSPQACQQDRTAYHKADTPFTGLDCLPRVNIVSLKSQKIYRDATLEIQLDCC